MQVAAEPDEASARAPPSGDMLAFSVEASLAELQEASPRAITNEVNERDSRRFIVNSPSGR
jgi:hypothetical protein